MGFFSKLLDKAQAFVKKTVKVALPIVGGLLGGFKGIATGVAATALVKPTQAAIPAGGGAATSPPRGGTTSGLAGLFSGKQGALIAAGVAVAAVLLLR